MLKSLSNILRLTVKELRAIRGDLVMVALILYVFSAARLACLRRRLDRSEGFVRRRGR